MKIHVIRGPAGAVKQHGDLIASFENDLVRTFSEEVQRTGSHDIVGSPDDADLVIVLESVVPKQRRDAFSLLAEPAVERFPEKCVTINYEDTPPGFLPGLYASLPASRFDQRRHRAWGYLFSEASFEPFYEQRDEIEPQLLFSFRGSFSHPVRKRIMASVRTDAPHAMTRVFGWFDHADEEKRRYVTELAESRFVICPRGVGTCSHRLFEVMAMARCPVIVSDEWVPPSFVDWESLSIRVPEAGVAQIPRILQREEHRAHELGQRARAAWEQFFAPSVRVRSALDELASLLAEGAGATSHVPRELWTSRAFARANGWSAPQRVATFARTVPISKARKAKSAAQKRVTSLTRSLRPNGRA